MQEVWKENYNGKYLVSNYGDIINRKTGYRLNHKPSKTHGYHMVSTRISPTGTPYVHRIVYEAFVGIIPEGLVINHLDGNKSNNFLGNLEVCTPSENIQHAVRMGLTNPVMGEDHVFSKITEEQVMQMYGLFRLGYNNDYIAKLFNIEFKHVSLLRNGKRWKHVFKRENMKVYRALGVKRNLPEAIHIYNMCMVSEIPQDELGKQLGIDPSQVSRIRTGKTWGYFRKHFNLPEYTPDWKDRRDALKLHVDITHP